MFFIQRSSPKVTINIHLRSDLQICNGSNKLNKEREQNNIFPKKIRQESSEILTRWGHSNSMESRLTDISVL